MSRPRFHLALPVQDLATARNFYRGVLGCGSAGKAIAGSISISSGTR